MESDPRTISSLVFMVISLSILLKASNSYWKYGFAPIEKGYLHGLVLQPIAILLGALSTDEVGKIAAVAAAVALLAFSILYLLYRRTHHVADGAASPAHKGWYTRKISGLAERVSRFRLRVRLTSTHQGAKRLEKEANTCYAFLQHLRAYALQHKIDTRPHETTLKQIWTDLEESRMELGGRSEAWWKKLAGTINDAIGLVNAILAIFGWAMNLGLPSAGRLALPASTASQ